MTGEYSDAKSEYAKDPKIRKDDVQLLQEWLNKQPHLPKISEYKIILFLQSCYYRIESAKTTIENYYTLRAHCPEFFANRSLTSVETISKLGIVYTLPKLSLQGYRVIFAKFIDSNSENFDCNDYIKFYDMTMSLILRKYGTSEGHALVVDMGGTSFGHIGKVNLNSARKYIYFLQEAMPVRIKEIHLLNVSTISQTLLNLIKPFMKTDIVEMLHIHGATEGLYDYIPKAAFTEEYGGQGGTLKEIMASQIKEFQGNESYFKEEELEIADDKKRVEKSKTTSESLGIQGSFKKLDID